MRSRLFALLVGSLFFMTGMIAISATSAAADPTPGCAGHGEWDQIDVNMKPSRIEEIIGNDGWFIDTANPDTFARGYNLCWTSNFGKVWFDAVSRFSFKKDVIGDGQRAVLLGSTEEVSRISRSYERASLTTTARSPGKPGSWDDRCWGKAVTIRGSFSSGGDLINGTNGRDVIFAYAGGDVINGYGGADRICGRWGNDTIVGGGGFDRVNGGGDFDLVCIGENQRKCP
jgi:hemolysin type calcium-binding protein